MTRYKKMIGKRFKGKILFTDSHTKYPTSDGFGIGDKVLYEGNIYSMRRYFVVNGTLIEHNLNDEIERYTVDSNNKVELITKNNISFIIQL